MFGYPARSFSPGGTKSAGSGGRRDFSKGGGRRDFSKGR